MKLDPTQGPQSLTVLYDTVNWNLNLTRKAGDPACKWRWKDSAGNWHPALLQNFTPKGSLPTSYTGLAYPPNATPGSQIVPTVPDQAFSNIMNDGREHYDIWSNSASTNAVYIPNQPNPAPTNVNGENMCLEQDANNILLPALIVDSSITNVKLVDVTLTEWPGFNSNGEPRRFWRVFINGVDAGYACQHLRAMTGTSTDGTVSGQIGLYGLFSWDGKNLTWTPMPFPSLNTAPVPCNPPIPPDGWTIGRAGIIGAWMLIPPPTPTIPSGPNPIVVSGLTSLEHIILTNWLPSALQAMTNGQPIPPVPIS